MPAELAGKVALVTGGGRGIGRATVNTFQQHGAKVVACGRSDRPSDLDSQVEWIVCDVSDATQVSQLKKQILEQLGSLSVLVNNAGVQIEKTVTDSSDDDWDLLMGVNARGVFNCCNAILPGWIMTEMADSAFALAKDPANAKRDALARHPVGRFGAPDDIANMALWLASDASAFANGQCFTVDGGMTSASPLNPGLF